VATDSAASTSAMHPGASAARASAGARGAAGAAAQAGGPPPGGGPDAGLSLVPGNWFGDAAGAGRGGGTLVGWLARVLRGGRRAGGDGDGGAGDQGRSGWGSQNRAGVGRAPSFRSEGSAAADPLSDLILHHF